MYCQIVGYAAHVEESERLDLSQSRAALLLGDLSQISLIYEHHSVNVQKFTNVWSVEGMVLWLTLVSNTHHICWSICLRCLKELR